MIDAERVDLIRLLNDAAHWGERAESYVHGMSESEFMDDQKTADAVCWCIGCVGEAAGAIMRRWPNLKSDLALAQAYAMRNRIAHGYFAVDLGVVWLVAKKFLPDLSASARRIIEQIEAR
jgi:uncharacterized protein with HEPN domain